MEMRGWRGPLRDLYKSCMRGINVASRPGCLRTKFACNMLYVGQGSSDEGSVILEQREIALGSLIIMEIRFRPRDRKVSSL